MVYDVKTVPYLPNAMNICFTQSVTEYLQDVDFMFNTFVSNPSRSNTRESCNNIENTYEQRRGICFSEVNVHPWTNDDKASSMDDIKDDIDHLTQLLDILLPLSPQEKELKQRLETEITDEIRKKKKFTEIDELENQIQKEIESHYNKFDENELTYNFDNKKCNKSSWMSSREMIGLFCCGSEYPCKTVLRQLQLESRFESSRIQSTLANVKCLQLHHNTDLFKDISVALINSLCNQLTSLHIDDYTRLYQYLDGWKLLSNDFDNHDHDNSQSKINTLEKINDKLPAQNESWDLSNIEELCLVSTPEQYWLNLERPETHIWSKYIDSQRLPHLKRLRIKNSISNSNYNIFNDRKSNIDVIERISSTITNGLEMLQFQLNDLKYHDFIDDLGKMKYSNYEPKCVDPCQIIKFWQNVFTIETCKNNVKSKPFVLKLKFYADWILREGEIDIASVKNTFENLLNEVGLLFVNMNDRLNGDIILGLKILISVGEGPNDKYQTKPIVKMLEQCVNDIILGSSHDETKMVDVAVVSKTVARRHYATCTIIFKNKNKGKLSDNCDLCYADHKFEYQCWVCQSECWID